jgi:UDP-sugar pyrophosphorylase
MDVVGQTGFVLVAGGLGERLGYNGIKIALPVDSITRKPFMQWYAEYLLAYQARACKGSRTIPLAIMTSDDTHTRTVDFLEAHDYFGLSRAQVTLMKQEKVPALINNQAHFAREKGSFLLETKPHGHGDVHHLLWAEGIATAWAKAGIKYVVFFQVGGGREAARGGSCAAGASIRLPCRCSAAAATLCSSALPSLCGTLGTEALSRSRSEPRPTPPPPRTQDTNALTFRAMACMLGVSAKAKLEYNSLTVPRTPGEAVGGIARLVKEDGTAMTVNVEYNQLDPLLRATVSPEGDVPDASGHSPYPGNINILALELAPYLKTLEATGGQMPEFVNPKYKDAERSKFAKPTRIECMMQDYPKLLHAGARVGFTQLDRWLCFSPVKNNAEDAAKKAAASSPPESASTGEADMYAACARMLRAAGSK